LPDDFIDVDFFLFPLDRSAVEVSRLHSQLRRQRRHCLLGGNDLGGFSESNHPGGNVHRIAKYIIAFYDCRPQVQAHPDGQRILVRCGEVCFCQSLMQRACRLRPGVSTRERARHLVADGFNHSPSMLTDDFSKERETACHYLSRSYIT